MTGSIELRTTSAAATKAMASALAAMARPGDLLLLAGEMGAGKTAFTQGFAAGLGVDEPVTSPTFTLVRSYEGRLVLHHLDVYRLEHLDEVADLSLSELLDSDAVTVIEWGDAVRAALPADYLELTLSFTDDDDERSITVRCVGPSWQTRSATLTPALEAWRC